MLIVMKFQLLYFTTVQENIKLLELLEAIVSVINRLCMHLYCGPEKEGKSFLMRGQNDCQVTKFSLNIYRLQR